MLATPNDRYINDAMIAQAVAQMLTRAGFKVSLDAMTQSQFFPRRNKRDFGIWLAGWGSDTGEMSSPLKSLIATPNRDKGMGTSNAGGYSNPKVDALLEQALATVDDGKRAALLAEASRVAMADYGALPLHFEMTTWAFRKELGYMPRLDQSHPGHAGQAGAVSGRASSAKAGTASCRTLGLWNLRPRFRGDDGV